MFLMIDLMGYLVIGLLGN